MTPRILIVEDNLNNLYFMRYLLEFHHFEVQSAMNGLEALSLLKRWTPDLILTDIQLPEMDGYELGCRLKADPELAKIPLVAATSFAMVGDREKALSSGFNGYLEKPFEPEFFVQQIKAFLPSQSEPTS